MAAALLSALGSGGCAALDVAAVPPLQLRRHARKCTKTKDKCGLCWWFHRGPGLRKKCRIPNSKKSWLTVAKMPSSKKDGSFNLRIGCVVCRCYHNKDSGTSCGLTRGGHSQGKENRSPNSKLPFTTSFNMQGLGITSWRLNIGNSPPLQTPLQTLSL